MHYTFNRDPNFWRNDNPNIGDSNCGSYALDVIEWYRPYDTEKEYGDQVIDEWIGYGTFAEALNASTYHHIENILNYFNNIRIIRDFSELKSDERLILYREGLFYENEDGEENFCEEINLNDFCVSCGYDWDFHFIWRDCKQKWHEKLGSTRIHEIAQPLFNTPWEYSNLIYNGPIIMLAKKENKYGMD